MGTLCCPLGKSAYIVVGRYNFFRGVIGVYIFFEGSENNRHDAFIDEPASHKTIMMRREAITEWLKKGVSKSVQQEIENHLSDTKNPNRYVSAAFSSLSGREVAKACSQLQEKGNFFFTNA